MVASPLALRRSRPGSSLPAGCSSQALPRPARPRPRATRTPSVKAHIAPGLYGIVIENPDGQAGVLAHAFTIPGGATSGSGGCHCSDTSASGSSPPGAAPLALALLAWPLLAGIRGPRARAAS